MCKNIFVNKHEQSNVVEDHINFLRKMEKHKLYMVEFNEDDAIKFKMYLSGCKVNGKKRWLIIMIIDDECIFSANDSIHKA